MKFSAKLKKTADRSLEVPVIAGLILYALTSQIYLLTFHGRFVHLYLAQGAFLGITALMFLRRKVIYVHSIPANLILLGFFFAMTSSVRGMELTYVQASLAVFCQFLVLYTMAAFIEERVMEEKKTGDPKKGILRFLIISLKAVTLAHGIYILLQFAAARLWNLNLNQILFFDLFGTELPGILYETGYVTCGFTFSPGLLGPVFIIGMVLFTDPLIRLLFIAAAFVCRSSTSVAGVGVATVLLLLQAVLEGKFRPAYIREVFLRIPGWKRVLIGAVFTLLLVLVFALRLYETVYYEAVYLFQRVFGAEKGGQHFDYFRNLSVILPRMSSYQKLFGYGNNCSGYPMGTFCGYTGFIGPAIVECDVVDTLLSRGLLGLLSTYGTFLYIMLRGYRVDRRYSVAMICFLVMGIGYNIQWHYMLFFLFLLLISLSEGVDLFAVADRSFTLRKKGDHE